MLNIRIELEKNILSVYDISPIYKKPTLTCLIFFDTIRFVWGEVLPIICMDSCMG